MFARHFLSLLTIFLAALVTVGCGADFSMSAGAFAEVDMDDETPSNEGDKFLAVGTNPFVVTAHDPQSTFAVDVDTASYDIFRRDMGFGMLPQTASVRLEEFVNFFRYDYPAPAHDDWTPFSVTTEVMPSPYSETTLLRVGLKGKDAPPEDLKRPANLVYLVDVSGSMSHGTKLSLVKTLLKETLTVLSPEDTISLVTYAGHVGVKLPPTPVSNPSAIIAAIDSMTSGGGTAGGAGIDLAYAQAEAGFIPGGVNRVLLCTDGDFNVGPSSPEELLELIVEKRKSGVTLGVLGFGMGNLNDAGMEVISNAGNGVYGVIASADQAISFVHERLLNSLTFIAKDVKIQVEFNPHHVLAYRLLGYENRAIADEDFTNDKVDAGEIGANHTVTALYELVHVNATIPMGVTSSDEPLLMDGPAFTGELDVTPGEFARVRVRYKHLDATENDPAHALSFGLEDDLAAANAEDASDDLRWAAAVAALAEILKDSPFSDVNHLPRIAEEVSSLAGTDDADRAEFVELVLQTTEFF